MYLAKNYGAQVTGIEVDPSLIEIAQKHIKEADLETSVTLYYNISAINLPFEDASFDIIFSKEVIVHVNDKESLFKEFFRVLRPGGLLIVVDWFKTTGTNSRQLNETLDLDALLFHYCTHHEYEKFIINAGFLIKKVQETSSFHLRFIRDEYNELSGYKRRENKRAFWRISFE